MVNDHGTHLAFVAKKWSGENLTNRIGGIATIHVSFGHANEFLCQTVPKHVVQGREMNFFPFPRNPLRLHLWMLVIRRRKWTSKSTLEYTATISSKVRIYYLK